MGFGQYLQDTRAELNHVAWPTRTQTIVYTVLVVLLSIFVSIYLGVFDYVFTNTLARYVNATGGSYQAPVEIPATSTPIATSTIDINSLLPKTSGQ